MLEGGRINWKQIAWLMIISRLVITITYLPALTSPPANQDIWLGTPVALVIALIMVIPIFILARRFPGQTLIQYSEILLGPLGKLVGIFYVWFFVDFSAIALRQFGDFFTTAAMPETPLLVFIIALVLLAASAVRNGLEVIGRMGQVIGPIILAVIILIVALIAKDLNLKALLPLFDKGYLPVVHNGFTVALRNSEILLVAMAAPYLNRRQDLGKGILTGIIVFNFFFILIEVAVICLFGVEEAKMRAFPFFGLTRMISVGDFLERVEMLQMGAWILGAFIRVTIPYYLATLGTAQLLGLKDYKPLVFPLGTIIVSLSILLFESHVELKEFTSYKIWTFYAFFFLVFLPLILLLTELVRKKGGQEQ